MAKNTTNTVTIASQTLSVVEYQGQRVVTLAMIDKVHERSEGTARKRFNDNKSRFIEGDDYFVRNSDEAREMGFTAPNGLTLITESGYLMLVKSFTDDLAWLVQRDLVRNYFRPRAVLPKKPRKPAFDTAFRRCMNVVACLPNVDENQRVLMAARGTKELTGVNPLEIVGYTSFPAPDQSNYKTPTQLGEPFGLTGQAVNRILADAGLQVHTPKSACGSDWTMTDRGAHLGRMFDTTRKGAKGSQQQLKWKPETADHVRPFAKKREAAA